MSILKTLKRGLRHFTISPERRRIALPRIRTEEEMIRDAWEDTGWALRVAMAQQPEIQETAMPEETREIRLEIKTSLVRGDVVKGSTTYKGSIILAVSNRLDDKTIIAHVIEKFMLQMAESAVVDDIATKLSKGHKDG